MRVTLILKSGDYEAHKEGCQHLGRARAASTNEWTIDAASRMDVAADAWADFLPTAEMTPTEALDQTHFAPCLNTLPLYSREEGSAAVWLIMLPIVVMVVLFAAQLAGRMAGVA